ncbi:adenylosuccinate synthetase [Melittangium boletus]|uniref:Adenylosuccinate synthetase n=1 Tax=Melittangium boletus DSM 14713 TaxID=1294270 RepID=A0A250ICI1_9BACT|nr:adenylosuccinate synthetase [Melittangium boletus]ATB28882.1 adenylosuccinate synthetase [Melittangium boletus DSM 14713]
MKGPREGRRVSIVVDLGFGDAGKGLLTDFLVRRDGAGLVVRYNGGAQAGHNVVTPEGRHHTFAQFGAGSFVPGVRTFLAHPFVLHPTALLVEGEVLRARGVDDVFERLRLSERARVITPFHQAMNRLRELARGDARHGSCGVGVGETVRDALDFPEDTVLAGDLRDIPRLTRKLRRIRERKHEELRALPLPDTEPVQRERSLFEFEGVIETWLERAARVVTLGLVVPDTTLGAWMRDTSTTVFEGAQGVLLDEWRGFHPFTTWSRCTADNALELIADSGVDAEVRRVGVLRSHGVRHGAGPLPTETGELRPLVSEHNAPNDWQGRVRYGWFDAVLARYALDVVGGVDELALTHVDLLARLRTWKAAASYQGGSLTRLTLAPSPSLEHQERLTRLLLETVPTFEEREPHEARVLGHIEQLLGRAVNWLSRGPRAEDVSRHHP